MTPKDSEERQGGKKALEQCLSCRFYVEYARVYVGSKEGGWRMGRRARARASRAAAAKRRNEKLRALSRIPELQNVFAGKGVLGVESKVDQPSA